MNNILNELREARKYMIETDDNIEGIEKIKELYQNLKEEILNLGDIDIEYKKLYIAFKGNTNIVDIEVYSSKIKLFINMKIGSLNDSMNISRDMSKTGYHGNGDYVVEISNEDDIENVIPLIKQSLKVNKK